MRYAKPMPQLTRAQFAARLEHERTLKGLSAGELSRLAGQHRNFVAGIERGAKGWPQLPGVLALAEALGVSVRKLTTPL
jgi:transcriptional regulator with XRE-family HTH domain